MATVDKTWTVNDIKTAARAGGSHFFDPGTMRFFGSRVLPTVYQGPGGIFFVTTEDQFRRELPKRFTVRIFQPDTADIGTAGEMGQYRTAGEARSAAKRLALGKVGGLSGLLVPPEGGGIPYELRGVKETTEKYRPVTVLEQFLADLRAHGNPPKPADATRARCLIQLAAQHHVFMEKLCSDEAFCRICDADGNHPDITECRDSIREVARRAGAAGVKFSGDPRGCTVKLIFPDGFTNDFGKEGYCVPTSPELED